ncbi:protein kinase domain-containing protein [Herpetosiphon llansteffanensis]|uniref:protein kinase domain-containing protein n=1 Tax=Herpetosiphon llansteffanensis TaxID=2094568 RepID=UPI000D7C095D|nr:protein kinase [Herpetosiphon llansteffanensis]
MNQTLANRYQLLATLGQGGMATVYRAHDLLLKRDVALKVLRPEYANNPTLSQQFSAEAQTAAQLSHAHIARIFDVGHDPSVGPFFVQELIDGQSLDQVLPVAAPQALVWTREIALALAAIHQQGYVHCDVKPQNIKINADGHAILLDFGIVQPIGTTNHDQVYGTPQYIAPERAEGGATTAASDIYALGIMLYELLTGRVPLDGDSAWAIVQRHLNEGVPALRQALPGTASAIEQLIKRATEREPSKRFGSAQALAGEIESIQQGANSATIAMPVRQRSTVSIHNMETTAVRVPPKTAALVQAQAQPTPTKALIAPPKPAAKKQIGLTLAALAFVVVVAVGFAKLSGNAEQPSTTGNPVVEATATLEPVAEATATIVIEIEATQAPEPTAASEQAPSMPNFVGLKRGEAEQQARNLGLSINFIEQPNDQAKDRILSQEPAVGSPIAANSQINLVIGVKEAKKPKGPGNGKGKDDD